MNVTKLASAARARISDLALPVTALISFVRKLFKRRRPRRSGGDSPGLAYAGVLVPVSPFGPHHLVAAKEFPPSDTTRCYPKD